MPDPDTLCDGADPVPDGNEEQRSCLTSVHYVGVDVGTGSARACIVNQDGDLISVASNEIHTWRSQTGSYEQSTNEIWQSICTSVKSAVAQAKIEEGTIRSIAFVATCSLAVFTHDTNESVAMTSPCFTGTDHNVMLWMHHKATEEAELINSTKHELLRYLGGSISPLMALPKVLWLKNNMPGQTFQQCKFFDLHDALAHIATGNKRFLCSGACHHRPESMGFGADGTIKGWSRDFLVDIGLDDLTQDGFRQVGGVCSNGQPPAVGIPLGTLCEKAARELRLPGNVMVASGTIDAYAGWTGTIGSQTDPSKAESDFTLNERLAVVAGTSACHILVSSEPIFTNGVWGPYKDFLIPGSWVMAGGQSAAGHLLQHVLETHSAYQETFLLAKAQNQNIFEYLNSHLQQLKTATGAPNITYLGRHLFFYGDHFGNRSPIADPTMTGSIVGLTGDVSVDNLAITYYGALEFLALQTRHIISVINDTGHNVRSIFMSGSLCLNEIFIELVATACNMPVIIPKYIQASVCYGATLLAAKAGSTHQDGHTEELWSVMKRMSKPGTLFKPVEDEYMKELLDVKYAVFLEQAERQRVFRNMIDNVPRRDKQKLDDTWK